jgi:hypothetical protein
MTQPAGSSPTEPGAPAASGLPDVEVADARARATTEATVPAGWTRRFVVGLALIGLVGLGVRVAYILVAKSDGDACGQKVCGDAYYYSLQAEVIAQGDGFERPFTGGEAADHPPLTALVATPAAHARRRKHHGPTVDDGARGHRRSGDDRAARTGRGRRPGRPDRSGHRGAVPQHVDERRGRDERVAHRTGHGDVPVVDLPADPLPKRDHDGLAWRSGRPQRARPGRTGAVSAVGRRTGGAVATRHRPAGEAGAAGRRRCGNVGCARTVDDLQRHPLRNGRCSCRPTTGSR